MFRRDDVNLPVGSVFNEINIFNLCLPTVEVAKSATTAGKICSSLGYKSPVFVYKSLIEQLQVPPWRRLAQDLQV